MNYILLISGQQYILAKGGKQYVPHLEGNIGDTIHLESAVLAKFSDKEVVLSHQKPQKAVVKIENQVKGDKVIAFKKKRRKGFMKKKGHRTHYTQISLQDII